MGTSGNFSVVLSDRPQRLLITASGAHKGTLTPDHFLQISARGRVLEGAGKPSAETPLHLAIVRARGARAVLHTHSVWATILSEFHARAGGLAVSGYEMLKGLAGVSTHAHREWIPILANDQDMPRLARVLGATLRREKRAHAVLLAGHGLYTWGGSLAEAERHVEILEFLLETIGHTRESQHGPRENSR
jgi:methylthioribulose-1-phosphate dehydratase